MRIFKTVSERYKVLLSARRSARESIAEDRQVELILAGQYESIEFTTPALSKAIKVLWDASHTLPIFYKSLTDRGIDCTEETVRATVTGLFAKSIRDNNERLDGMAMGDIASLSEFFKITLTEGEIAEALVELQKRHISAGNFSSLDEFMSHAIDGRSLLPRAIVECVSWSNYGEYHPLEVAAKLHVPNEMVINAARQHTGRLHNQGFVFEAAAVRFSVNLSIPKIDRDAFELLRSNGYNLPARTLLSHAVKLLGPKPPEDGIYLLVESVSLDRAEADTLKFAAISSA